MPMSKIEPQLQITTYDTDGEQLDKLTTNISSVPAHLGYDDAALIALLNAARRYDERHPRLAAIEIAVVTEAT
jgi:hypothetical protein